MGAVTVDRRNAGTAALIVIMFFSIAGAVSACGPEEDAKGSATAVVEPAAAEATTTTQAPTTKPSAGIPKSVPKPAPASPTFTEEVADAAFTQVTRPLAPYTDASERIALGHTICDALNADISVEAVAITLMENSDAETAGAWLGASAAAYCPAHSWAVENIGN